MLGGEGRAYGGEKGMTKQREKESGRRGKKISIGRLYI